MTMLMMLNNNLSARWKLQQQQVETTTICIIQVDDVSTDGYALQTFTKDTTSHAHITPQKSNAKINLTNMDF